MDDALRQFVMARAGYVCEYCRLPQEYDFFPFQIDHIIAQKHHGPTSPENLAWSCGHCNVHKGPNIAGRDLETETITRLFHPRHDLWADHFFWDSGRICARTGLGRVTIDVLNLNDSDRLELREFLIQGGMCRFE